MSAIRVDEQGEIRLDNLTPGDCYQTEIISADEIKLRRVQRPSAPTQMTYAEALQAIEKSPLHFTQNWEALEQETRE